MDLLAAAPDDGEIRERLCTDDADWAAALMRMPPYRNMTFWNFDGTMQFEMMRLAPDLGTQMVVLRFVYRRESDATPLLNSGYISRDDFESDTRQFDLTHAETRSSVVLDGVVTRRQFNNIYRLTVCGCGQYMRCGKDPACAMCYLNGTVRTSVERTCPVCLDAGLSGHMPATTCCAQSIHVSCLARCGARCPLCRGAPKAPPTVPPAQ